MSIKTARKLGFFASLAMLLGSVVGIGIFLKNHSILRGNDWNGIGTLFSWIIGGILSLGAAVSFSEISSLKPGKVAGLPNWSEKVGGKKFGYFVRFNYGFFYFIILNVAISFFAAETLSTIYTGVTGGGHPNMFFITLIALGIFVFFTTMNFVSVKLSGSFQLITTVLKFLPLVIVALLGIVLATTNNEPTQGKYISEKPYFGHNAFDNGSSFNFVKMLSTLPAVLFAYDAFLNAGSLKNKMKNPEKLPKVVLFGMITVIVLYMFIALAAILHGTGMVSGKVFGIPPEGLPPEKGITGGFGIFDQVLNNGAARKIGMIVIVFICISTLGVMNGITAGTLATYEQILDTNTFFGSRKFKKFFGEQSAFLLVLAVGAIFFIIIGIPAIVLNTDTHIDGISNFPTNFFFAIYGVTILLYTIKRSKFETKKINNILFNIMAWTAIIGIAFVVGYQLFFGMTTDLIINWNKSTSAGLFIDHVKLLNSGLFAYFISTLLVFILLPLLNFFLCKKFENRDVTEYKNEIAKEKQ